MKLYEQVAVIQSCASVLPDVSSELRKIAGSSGRRKSCEKNCGDP
jgi:hypothetical protein